MIRIIVILINFKILVSAIKPTFDDFFGYFDKKFPKKLAETKATITFLTTRNCRKKKTYLHFQPEV